MILTHDKRKRLFTACRLIVQWSMGAVMGSILATNRWNRWTSALTVIYFMAQLVAIPLNPYKKK